MLAKIKRCEGSVRGELSCMLQKKKKKLRKQYKSSFVLHMKKSGGRHPKLAYWLPSSLSPIPPRGAHTHNPKWLPGLHTSNLCSRQEGGGRSEELREHSLWRMLFSTQFWLHLIGLSLAIWLHWATRNSENIGVIKIS